MRKLWVVAVLLCSSAATAATYTVTNTNDSGAGSLRQAILDANANPGADSIVFAIGSGAKVIVPTSNLPAITDTVNIDATTQPGYAGRPLITLDGSLVTFVPSVTGGFNVQAAGTTVSGFAITDYHSNATVTYEAAGIIVAAPNVTIKGCYLGVAADGRTAAGNESGIRVSNGNGLILGVPGAGNVISGNTYEGIEAWETVTGTMTVQNNIVGMDATGTVAVPNVTGAFFGWGATSTLILNNIFAGNSYGDIDLTSNNSIVKGNKIGISASGQTIGAPYYGGFSIYGAASSTVSNVTVGGSNPGDSNEIFSATGLYIDSATNVTINGNDIHNGLTTGGIYINQASSCTISNNRIHNNGGTAVQIVSGAANRITNNSIYENGGGIQLGSKIPLPNDPGDGDIGANFGQNYPVLTSAVNTATATHVTGTLNSTPSSTFRIEFFATPSCDASGYGEGKTYLDSGPLLTDAAGNASFAADLPLQPPGYVITATATDASNNTSEFSACAPIQGAGAFHFATDSVSVNEGAGTVQLTVSRSNGAVGTATVDYATHDLTAKAPGDYTAASGTLTFAAGETSKSITIPIIDDKLSEATEQFTVSLSNATVGAVIITPAIATVSIIDNDPVQLSIDDVAIPEGDAGTSNAVFTISLPVPWAGAPFQVSATTSDGTAHAGVDYIATNASVTFNTGDQTKSVSVPIIGNTTVERNKTFTLTIAPGCCGVPAVGKGTGVCTILNDDYKLIPYTYTLLDGQSANFTIEIGQPLASAAEIPISISNPAVASVPSSVTIAGGFTIVNVPVEAKSAGSANLSATLPASLGGATLHATINVLDGSGIVFTPASAQVASGATATESIALQPSQTAQQTVTLSIDDPTVVAAPSSVTVGAGETATFSIKGLKAGSAVITATSSVSPQTFTLPVEVEDAVTLPSVTSLAPSSGPIAGGTPITIAGTNFGADCSVSFGAAPAVVTASTSTAISATTASHAAGSVDVTITCGGRTTTLANAFTYLGAPSITAVSPSIGSTSGGTVVRISGRGFDPLCWPFFGSAAARMATVSSEAIVATTPAHAAGTVDVGVRCAGGAEASLASAFAYSPADDAAPLVTSINPFSAAPGATVTLTGARFRTKDVVTFGSTRAVVLSTTPDQHVVVVPEMQPGLVSVTVTDVAGRASTTGPVFTVLAAAPVQIGGATPATVAPGGELTITGGGFRPSIHFQLDATPLVTMSMTASRAVVRVPPPTALGVATLKAVDGGGNVVATGPAITVGAAPMIAAVAPFCVSANGGTTITISGSGFASGATVAINGIAATAVFVPNATTITATVAAGSPGAAVVTVTNPDGSPATFSGGFRYSSPLDPDGCAPRPHGAEH